MDTHTAYPASSVYPTASISIRGRGRAIVALSAWDPPSGPSETAQAQLSQEPARGRVT
jgi:hypothetical protein